MSIVRDILEHKGGDVFSVAPNTTLSEALATLAARNVGSLVVIDEGNIAGIFSERDYARRSAEGRLDPDTPVARLMTRHVFCVQPDTTLNQCMALMTEKRFRHLPVLQDDKLIGVISIGDVVNRIISEQQFTIDELEKYIYDTGYAASR
jgi:CBS domain-containing protein